MKISQLISLNKNSSNNSINTFSFTLPQSVTTSAGIYNADDSLVRTLWSAEPYIAGTHVYQWDGLVDNRTVAPSGSYYAKVLSSNVQYSWDGARIGNTSTALTGGTIHRSFAQPQCIAITGNNFYYGTGYHERNNSQYVTNLNDIHVRNRVVGSNGGTNQLTSTCCTDGIYVYWGGDLVDMGAPPSGCFVFATRVDNNALVNFQYGIGGRRFYSAIAPSDEVNSNYITSLAVQKNGQYLFVARNQTSELRVVDKTTGQLIRNITIAGIRHLAIDAGDNLWITSASTVEKYTVNSDGTITSVGITITALISPGVIAISPDNSTVAVVDNTDRVVCGYSTTSATELWVLGIVGGYATDATVTDYKFFNPPQALAYEPNGSLWVLDAENFRMQHYDAAQQYLNQIAYLPNFYEVHIDTTNRNRLYVAVSGNFLEFELDYSKTLDNGQNGSWKLVKHWSTPLGGYYIPGGVPRTNTFNGKTFAVFRADFQQYRHDVFELVPGGQLRKTKIIFPDSASILENGKKFVREGYDIGQPVRYYVYDFIGFDGDNDPLWSTTPAVQYNSPVLEPDDPLYGGGRLINNAIVSFQTNAITNNNNLLTPDYHLSSFDISTGRRIFKTAIGTSRWYGGDFPPTGEFDNGNGTQVPHAGAYHDVSGTNILWTYRGEFWKDIEANYFNHVHESGLFIGQFGRNKLSNDVEADPPGNEGNMFSGSWVQDTSDRAYVFSGGEGVFAGIHRWKIEGLNTVSLQTCNFNASLMYTLPQPNFMQGLIHGEGIENGVGWSISHPLDGNTWNVIIGQMTPSKYGSQDVRATYDYEGYADKIRSVSRTLGTNTSNHWKFGGKINLDGNTAAHTDQGGYVQILDHTGKVIAHFFETEPSQDNGRTDLRFNGLYVHRYELGDRRDIGNVTQNFSIENNNGTLTFKYFTYTISTNTVAETGADITRPTTLRLYFTPSQYYPRNRRKTISVNELRLTLL